MWRSLPWPAARRGARPRPLGAALAGLTLVVALAACSGAPVATPSQASGSPTFDSPFAYADARPAPKLALTDQDGRAFDLADLRGSVVLIYFGYTHCPDVCPATIGRLNDVVATVDVPLRIVLVTVDPERDTVAALREYVRYLLPEYLALTGSASEIRAAADDWGVTYARIDTGSASGYAMAHTAEVYLVDPNGRLVTHYPFGTEAEAIARDVGLAAG
jgi:protein SCO1/2